MRLEEEALHALHSTALLYHPPWLPHVGEAQLQGILGNCVNCWE